jgi:hypothetical protein
VLSVDEETPNDVQRQDDDPNNEGWDEDNVPVPLVSVTVAKNLRVRP